MMRQTHKRLHMDARENRRITMTKQLIREGLLHLLEKN